MKELKKVGVISLAKIMSLLYFIASALVLVPYSLVVLAQGGKTKEGVLWWMLLVLPLFYYLLSFLVIAIGSLLYNFLAGKIGGIKVEFNEEQNVAG
jgi:hypothetical protein